MMNYCCSRNIVLFVLVIASSLPSSIKSAKVSSNFQVQLPKELSSRYGGYDHRKALVGTQPSNNTTIQQNVVYTRTDLCSGPIPQPSSSIRRHPTDSSLRLHTSPATDQPPFILMVDRGNCTIVQKVRNAQYSGAVAVIIADNTCQCKYLSVCESTEGWECEINEPVMEEDEDVDDASSGGSSDIIIPAMLLFKQDADPIKTELEKGTIVRVDMSWSVVPTSPDDGPVVVELDLWTTVTDEESTIFQMMWMEAQAKLGDTVAFTPHYHIYDGVEAKCFQEDDGTSLCSTLCTNEGRYCALDPDDDLDYGISGANVVDETLRRLCIWDSYGTGESSTGSGSVELFQYMREFDVCDNAYDFMSPKCIQDAMGRANIDPEKVSHCMEQSGGTDRNEDNEILRAQINEGKRNGITEERVVYVNGVPIRGTLHFDVVFKAVCAEYISGTEPDICTKCADCADSSVNSEYNCVKDDYCPFKYDFSAPTTSVNFNFKSFCNGFIVIAAVISLAVFTDQRYRRAGDISREDGITDELHELTYGMLT